MKVQSVNGRPQSLDRWRTNYMMFCVDMRTPGMDGVEF